MKNFKEMLNYKIDAYFRSVVSNTLFKREEKVLQELEKIIIAIIVQYFESTGLKNDYSIKHFDAFVVKDNVRLKISVITNKRILLKFYSMNDCVELYFYDYSISFRESEDILCEFLTSKSRLNRNNPRLKFSIRKNQLSTSMQDVINSTIKFLKETK